MDIETAKKARDIIWATYGKDPNIAGVGITTIKRKLLKHLTHTQ